MNFSITTEYPLWLLIFCVLLGAVISLLLYYKNNKYNISPLLKKILTSIRFVAITIIAFLLLSPLVKTVSRFVEKPIIIIAQDNSESIPVNKDSVYYKKQYKEQLNKFIEAIKAKYDVKTFSFGDKVSNNISFSFNDKLTNISALFDKLQTLYTNRNVGALILATDGMYNRGKNPLYASDYISYPIYTLALGDTSIFKDIIISKINYNKVTYLGNKFPVEITIKANRCKRKSSKLTITKGNEIVFSKELDFSSTISTQTVLTEIEAKQSGIQRYHVFLTPIPEEVTEANNASDFFVEVLDQRRKILILANSPHPDIAALKESIEKNDNYEVESALAENFNKTVLGYNLVILHQLPSENNNIAKIIESLNKSGTPVMYIIGNQSNFNVFNELKTGLNIITNNKSSQNEALPIINNDFALFTINEEVKNFSYDLPPLYSPYGTYKTSNSSNVLFYQKIGSVATKQPLVMFNQQNNVKSCIIAGEGIWKWKLADYRQNKNHDIFNSILSKFIQYLAITEDKGFFRLNCNNNFYENENVELYAEVYNESYEMINTPEISLDIYKKYDILFL